MAGGIKGITIEIGGDTTKLGQAIGDVEKKSRSLQNELRQVEKLLKLDPTNVELLSQKQELLTQNVSETSKKLDLLKEAEKQVTEQFKRGEASEEQVRALQREIIKTENALNSMTSELNSTNTALKNVADGTDTAEKHTKEYAESVEKAKAELEDFKGKASDAFDTLKTGATVAGGAMVATAGYALKLSTDFDKASNTLINKTGASADEIDSLNQSMENVYANNFGESIEDVANAMATVRQNTKLTGDELEATTQYAILMRDTFEFEVNESTRTAKMLMDTYGISAKDAYNLIAQGAQNGLDKNGDLLDTINEYSAHFSGLGIGAEDMFNMLVNGAENGTFSVDKLGDTVKEFGIRVKDESKGTMEAFSQLGLDADDMSLKFAQGGETANEALKEVTTALFSMDDPLTQNQVGVALFGTMWEDLGADAVKSIMDVNGNISTTSDALDTINEKRYDDIGSALSGLGRTIETDVLVPLGEELKPVVEDVIDYVEENGPQIKDVLSGIVGKIGEFVGFIVNNGATILSVIGGIGGGLIAWNVASMITGVVNAIKAFKLANEGATVAQWAMNVAMNANPIGLIVALIAGLVTAFVLLWNNCEGFRNFWIKLWDIVVGAVKTAWNFIVELLSTVGTWINENVIQPVINFFKDMTKKVADFFSQLWEDIKSIWSGVSKWFNDKIITPVSDFFSNMWSNLTDGASKAWQKVKDAFSSVKTWFSDTFSSAWQKVKDVFANWGEFFSGLWDSIKNTFSKIGTNISNAISGTLKSGLNGIISSIEKIINGGINLINGAINLINEIPGVNIGKIKKLELPRLARGGIVDRPTIAQIGEDGREAIVPLEHNTEWIDNVARKINDRLGNNPTRDTSFLDKLDGIYERLGRLQVVMDSGTLVGEILDGIDTGLSNNQLLKKRGV